MLTTSYEAWLEQQEELHAIPMTAGEYDREETYIGGANHPDREWLCSDRDCWYRNPYFTGTRTEGHPEDDHYEMTEEEKEAALKWKAEFDAETERRREFARLSALNNDDIPF